MRFKKLLMVVASIVATLSFTGCTPYQEGLATGVVVDAVGTSAYSDDYYYGGYNYGTHRNNYYRYGVQDGCKSRQRGYTVKNRYRWDNYSSYRSGWYAGNRQCRATYTNNYNKGYSDGCWSKRNYGTRKNRRLYNRNIGNYARGWDRGYRNCRRRY